MCVWVLAVEEGDLHEWAGEWVVFWREGYVEAGEDAVVESALQAGGGDPGVGQQREDLGGELGATFAGEGGLVEFGGEAVEAGWLLVLM